MSPPNRNRACPTVCEGIDDELLSRIAESVTVEDVGFTKVPKDKAARATTGPNPSEVSTKNCFTPLYLELDVFAPTADDNPVDGPVDSAPLEAAGKWFDRVARSVPDGCEIKKKWEAIRKSREMRLCTSNIKDLHERRHAYVDKTTS